MPAHWQCDRRKISHSMLTSYQQSSPRRGATIEGCGSRSSAGSHHRHQSAGKPIASSYQHSHPQPPAPTSPVASSSHGESHLTGERQRHRSRSPQRLCDRRPCCDLELSEHNLSYWAVAFMLIFVTASLLHKHRSQSVSQEDVMNPAVLLSPFPEAEGESAVLPTERISQFVILWQEGQCDKLGRTLLEENFTFRVSNYVHRAGPPIVLSRAEFLDGLCRPWGGKFRTNFLTRQNLGVFGTVTAYGVDLLSPPFSKQDNVAPCLAPFYATFTAKLQEDHDGSGKMIEFQELIDVRTYTYYAKRCYLAGARGKHHLGGLLQRRLKKHRKRKHRSHQGLGDQSVSLLRKLFGGECKKVAKRLPSSFYLSRGFNGFPASERDMAAAHLSRERFINQYCRDMHNFYPTAMHPLSVVTDGNVATVSGPSVSVVPIENEKSCVVFVEGSVGLNWTIFGPSNEPIVVANAWGLYNSGSFQQQVAECNSQSISAPTSKHSY